MISKMTNEDAKTYLAEQRAFSRKRECTGSVPNDVKQWVAEIRDRLEHVWREPITQNEATALLLKSAKFALEHECYQEQND